MEGLDRFTRWVFRVALGATLVMACVLLPWNRAASLGMILGGLGSALGFLILRRGMRLDPASKNMLNSRRLKGRAVRMMIYAAILSGAYRLDPTGLRGFFAAAAGLLTIRVAIAVVALVGVGLTQEEK